MFLTSVTILILQWVSVVLTDAPWPYIQVYPPVNTSDDRTPLYFGLMLSIIGFPSIRAAPGIQIALDSINSDPSILPGYSLHYTLSDSQCKRSTSVSGIYYQLTNGPTKLSWIGSGCLTATEYTTPITQIFNITQLSCATTSPYTIDRENYRYFFQLQPTATVMNKGLIGIINRYSWTKVGLITWRDSFFSVVADHFKRLLTENTITYSERLLSADGTEINGDPFDAEKRVYVIIVSSTQARLLLCQAFKRGLKYPRNQFLFIGEYNDEWLIEPNPTRDLGCTLEERKESFMYSLTVHIPNHANDDSTLSVGGLSAIDFRKQYFEHAILPTNEGFGLTGNIGERFLLYSSLCYEATFTLALALHKTYLDLRDDYVLNMEAAKQAGLSDGETFTLANFSYSNSIIVERMFHHLNNTDFLGITGNQVKFDNLGSRKIKIVEIAQYAPRDMQEGNVYHVLGKIDLSDETKIQLYNITNHLFWPRGIPNDGTPVAHTVTVHPALTIVYDIIGIAGIILAIACGIFNFINRKKKLIKLSSPKLNYIIILGAILFYISGIFRVLPSVNPDVILVHCNITPIISFIGYSMVYGTILVKMFRVWYIFNHPTMHKKFVITDCHLLCVVLSFIGLDLFIMLSFITIQGFRHKLVATLNPNAEDPQTVDGSTEVVHEHFLYACNIEGRRVVVVLMYIYKILVQVISLILAFRTRKVKVKGLDDSKYIIATIYVTTIVLPVSIFAVTTLRSHVNAFPAILGASHYFGATVTLLLVFVPRMIGLYKDPTGENVFQNQNHAATTFTLEDNNVKALRRDVQQLRVSLHLAQKKKKKNNSNDSATEDDIVLSANKEVPKPCVSFTDSAADNDYVQTHIVTKTESVPQKPSTQSSVSTSTEDSGYSGLTKNSSESTTEGDEHEPST